MLPKRDLTYQNLCPDHLRIFFIAKLSTKTFQENYTDGAQAAGSIRKDKIYFFDYYIFDIGMHLPGRRDVQNPNIINQKYKTYMYAPFHTPLSLTRLALCRPRQRSLPESAVLCKFDVNHTAGYAKAQALRGGAPLDACGV